MSYKMILTVHEIKTIESLVKQFNVLVITQDNEEWYVAGVDYHGLVIVYDEDKMDGFRTLEFKNIKELVLE